MGCLLESCPEEFEQEKGLTCLLSLESFRRLSELEISSSGEAFLRTKTFQELLF